MSKLKPLEATLNRYLALDPESSSRLESLEGKVISIELAALPLSFQLLIENQRVVLLSGQDLPADVRIKGSPLSLASLSLVRDKKTFFSAADISMEGDAELGQQILNLFAEMEIDWEEQLSHLIGDMASHQVGTFARKLFAWGKEAKETLILNTNEYLHEEQPWFPPREALDNFYKDVDELRLDLDRLEARIKNL